MCKREYLQLIDQEIVTLGKYDRCSLLKWKSVVGMMVLQYTS